MRFQIKFSGHSNIRSLHQKTIEITKDSTLSLNGDCIVGINASCGCKDIPDIMKKKLQNSESNVKLSLKIQDYCFEINGKGHDDLLLSHPHDIVIRKSEFVCPRTLAVNCNNASDDIPREIIQLLQKPDAEGIFEIEVN